MILIQVVALKNEYFERYLDLNKIYPLFKHDYWKGNLQLWEIEPRSMKRAVSQLLLQWENEVGWNWDLDS